MASANRNETLYYIGTSALELEQKTASRRHDPRSRFVLIEGGLSTSSRIEEEVPNRAERIRPERKPLSSYDEAPKLILRPLSSAQWALVLLVAILSIIACFTISYNLEARAASEMEMMLNSADTIEVTVTQGDTIWGIASEYTAEGIDTYDVVQWIEEVNHIDGGVIHVGERLVVPAS